MITDEPDHAKLIDKHDDDWALRAGKMRNGCKAGKIFNFDP